MNQNIRGAAPATDRRSGNRGLLAVAISVLVSAAAVAAPGGTAVAAPAQGATKLTVSTAEDPLDIAVPDSPYPYHGFNQGWWAAETGHDWDGYDNTNYATGWSDYYGVTRSFFSFSMARVEGRVTEASLQIPRGCADSPDARELVKFWDVTTPAADLNRGSAPIEPTFRDIGGGTEYGRSSLASSVTGGTVTVKLNGRAIAAINKTRGTGYFSVGAAVMTLGTGESDEIVFGCTGEEPVSLVLTTR